MDSRRSQTRTVTRGRRYIRHGAETDMDPRRVTRIVAGTAETLQQQKSISRWLVSPGQTKHPAFPRGHPADWTAARRSRPLITAPIMGIELWQSRTCPADGRPAAGQTGGTAIAAARGCRLAHFASESL